MTSISIINKRQIYIVLIFLKIISSAFTRFKYLREIFENHANKTKDKAISLIYEGVYLLQ